MSQLWTELEALSRAHSKEHASKMGPLHITKAMDPFMVKWQGATAPNTQALFFTVENTDSSSTHHVGLAVNPSSGFLTMWCGDKSYADSQGVKDNTCNFWRQKGTLGQYVCKHCWHVLQEMNLITDKAQQKKVEAKLGLGATTTSAVNGHGDLETIVDFWVSGHLFGPTGSGKTHDVIEMLNKHTDQIVVKPIFISSGLQDTDLLMKLIPSPESDATQEEAALTKLADLGTAVSLKTIFHRVISLIIKLIPKIGRPGWKRLHGELLDAFLTAKNGDKKVVVLLEELTRSNESFRRMLIKVMDNQSGSYTLHDFTTGQYITVPEDKLIFVATSNFGYEDTSPIDPALARRFPITLFYDYNEEKEKEIIGEILPAAKAKELHKIAKQMRTQYRAGRLPRPLDTGSLIEWARMVKRGKSIKDAARISWINRIVEVDKMGFPETGQIEAILDLFKS